ncbi:peptide/nickel transport system substrate-binding protein/oligopeptide transport system substrate-binding protein [Novosphingobium capsulatum]|uniref:Peptide/nickel transport system substrate-binding protein/oligopeptide transport system substrate-binding protein n=1 Tax=Novosphingobium capsulatum TaxID=13688 RepID=A0ABU1MRQ9_9SPHN|nr:ABC transporter substrate-binding protein [Novosphingobium capsulatum]MDR6513040.1 peptide/nickel transport system substrate-binding protein/oligopeptide transport system substrate-binding protein [Novosphingobium capsulatum]
MAPPSCHLRRAAAVLLPGVALMLASCGGDRRGALPVALAGDDSAFQTAAPRPTPAAQVLRAATVEGLVGFDAQGRVVPAIAERWIVTDDGLSYIFRLRDGTWPDGTAIDAPSVAAALRRAQKALAGTALGLDLAPIDEIRVMTDRVVEVDLSAPLPDLLTLLAQPELGLPRARIGSGPLGLRREGLVARLSPIPPERRGLPAQDGFSRSVRPLRVEVESMAVAAQRFNDGLVDVALGGTIDSLPLAGTTMLSRGNVQLDPVMGLFGLQVVRAQGFLADPLRREALALAIDRDGLVGAFGIGGWSGTTRLVSPEVPDSDGSVGERWVGTTLDQRRALARQRVMAWLATGQGAPRLRVAAPDGPGTRLALAHLAADFATIGVTLERVDASASADLRLVDSVARYTRAAWFLNQVACPVSPAGCSPQGDALAAQARAERDPQARMALLAQAETAVTAANSFIPIARPLRWSLVRSRVTGFSPNPWGWHPLPPLTIVPK